MRGTFQCLDDGQEDTVYVLEHFVVPEAQDTVAPGFQPRASLSIRCAPTSTGVLTTIELDDQLSVETGEIDDEGAPRHLAFKFVSFKLVVAQARP